MTLSTHPDAQTHAPEGRSVLSRIVDIVGITALTASAAKLAIGGFHLLGGEEMEGIHPEALNVESAMMAQVEDASENTEAITAPKGPRSLSDGHLDPYETRAFTYSFGADAQTSVPFPTTLDASNPLTTPFNVPFSVEAAMV